MHDIEVKKEKMNELYIGTFNLFGNNHGTWIDFCQFCKWNEIATVFQKIAYTSKMLPNGHKTTNYTDLELLRNSNSFQKFG